MGAFPAAKPPGTGRFLINTINVMGCKTLILQPILNDYAEKFVTLRG